MNINILDVIPTHNELRDYAQVRKFISMLESGQPLKPVIIKRFEDAKYYLHDGLHRIAAYWLHGVQELNEEQYVIKHFTYKQFLEINLQVGWYTPFDLKTECRKSDLRHWKSSVEEIRHCVLDDENIVKLFIMRHGKEYKEPRRVWTVEDVLKQRKENDEHI